MTKRNLKDFLSSPRGAISLIGFLILSVELLIMVLIEVAFRPILGTSDSMEVFWEFLDPILLTLVVTPCIYILAVRPLERQRVKLQQQFNELSIAAVTFESQEGVVVTDVHNNILRVNHSFTKITGYSNEEVIGKTPAILQSGRQDKEFYRDMWHILERDKFWSGEIWNRRKNGEIYPEWLTITAVLGAEGQVTNYVAIFSDVTERKALDEKIQHLAFYDPLTQLPNRRLLLNRLDQALSASAREHRHGALMFLDIDHFKSLNDIYGHDVGDQFLIEVAKRISNCIREQDSASRFGGDEFVVMLEDLGENAEQAAHHAETVAEKLREALACTYYLRRVAQDDDQKENHIEFQCTSSLGIALFYGHDETIEALFKRADLAIYSAKSSGRNSIRFFDPVMQATVESRANLEADLHLALETHQFKLYYQIQVDNLQRPLSAEVLLRWEHPQRGLVYPGDFISLAEETDLIFPIGQWVLDSACAQLKTWQNDSEMCHLQLAVNISAKQFHQPDFVKQVMSTVRQHDINPLFLKLELTESLILDDIDDTIFKMKALKEFGVKFSLDDFGTGFSSLSHLKRLPLDQIKIDQSFVRNITSDRGDVAMVHAIMELGMNFELDIIAEGVETEMQFKTLLRYGCMNFQGFLFSKAVPLEQFELSIKETSL